MVLIKQTFAQRQAQHEADAVQLYFEVIVSEADVTLSDPFVAHMRSRTRLLFLAAELCSLGPTRKSIERYDLGCIFSAVERA